jgi:hypothetical protein
LVSPNLPVSSHEESQARLQMCPSRYQSIRSDQCSVNRLTCPSTITPIQQRLCGNRVITRCYPTPISKYKKTWAQGTNGPYSLEHLKPTIIHLALIRQYVSPRPVLVPFDYFVPNNRMLSRSFTTAHTDLPSSLQLSRGSPPGDHSMGGYQQQHTRQRIGAQ